MPLDTIVQVLEREQLYRDLIEGDDYSHEDCVSILTRQVGLATPETPGDPVDPERWERQMIRIAATALGALQNHIKNNHVRRCKG